jgi:hypothetical protein
MPGTRGMSFENEVIVMGRTAPLCLAVAVGAAFFASDELDALIS